MTAVTVADLSVLAEGADICYQATLLESSQIPHASQGSLMFAQLQLRVAKLALHAAADHLERYLANRPAPPPNSGEVSAPLFNPLAARRVQNAR